MKDLIAKAQALAPAIKERSDAAYKSRAIPHETIADMQNAGLFRCLQPKQWGGFENHPRDFFAIGRALGAACPSTGWIYAVIGVHNWQLALFPLAAQREVWGEDTSTLIASSYMPVGKVKPVAGGFEFSGSWGFSSGVDHCSWVFLGGLVPKEDGSREMRTFLVPKADYEIIDDWQVSGLEGTGSKTVKIRGCFVPEHRTHKFIDGFRQESPGNAFNQAPLYRLPYGQLFIRSITSNSLSMLEGALGAFVEVQKSRFARSVLKAVADNPPVQQAAAKAAVVLREQSLLLEDHFNQMMTRAEAGKPLEIKERVQWRFEASLSTERCAAAIDELFKASGGSAIFHSNPIAKYFKDIHAASAHYANNPWGPGCNLGAMLLGKDNTDHFL